MPTLLELREQFKTALAHAESCRQKYDGKPESGEEIEKLNTEYDGWLSKADDIKDEIARIEKHDRISKWANEVRTEERPRFEVLNGKKSREEVEREEKHRAAYKVYLQGQTDTVEGWRNSPEVKAYQSDNPAGGGFAIMPQVLVAEILTLMKDLVFIRGLATRYEVVTAESLGHPAIDTDPSDSDWTSELNVGSEETTMAVGKREMRPNPLAKYIKLSKKLLRQVPNFEAVVLDRLAYKMGITEEKAFLTGTGSNQPLGVYVASSQGISTARDVTAAASTAIAGDDVVNTFYNLKAQYRARSVWVLNRAVVKAVRKLKDTTNNYLWTAPYGGIGVTGPGGGLQDTPETLMGRPLKESEYSPSTIASSSYTMIVGDFSRYEIADALDMQIQVLYELFALTNQMGYIMRKETDGMPVLEEAFSRLIH